MGKLVKRWSDAKGMVGYLPVPIGAIPWPSFVLICGLQKTGHPKPWNFEDHFRGCNGSFKWTRTSKYMLMMAALLTAINHYGSITNHH